MVGDFLSFEAWVLHIVKSRKAAPCKVSILYISLIPFSLVAKVMSLLELGGCLSLRSSGGTLRN